MNLPRICNSLIFIFLCSPFLSVSAAPDEQDIVIKTYIKFRYGTLGIVPSQMTADALVSAINEYREGLYQECLARESSCATTRVTGYKIREGREGRDPYDESVGYTLLGTYIHTYNGTVVNTKEVTQNDLMISYPTCPDGFHGPTSVDGSKKFCYQNVTDLPSPSCPTQTQFGNPIDFITKEKREHEIDFATADGLLKLERFYINQFEGWFFGVPQRLIDLDLTASGVSTEIQNAACHRASHGDSKYVSYCFKYLKQGRLASKVVKGSDGSTRQFKKIGSDFFASNNYSGKFQPYNQNGYAWVYTKPDNSKEFYSATGLLRERQTAVGRKVIYEYNSSNLSKISDDSGRSIVFGYDDKNRIVKATLPDGNFITYDYDDYNNITNVNWPDGYHKSYLYNETEYVTAEDDLSNPFHLLTGKINENGIRNGTYKYAGYGRALSTEKADGVEKYEFSSLTSITNPQGSKISLQFKKLSDTTNLLRKQSQPAGSGCNASSQYLAYNTDGLVSQRKEFNGNVTQYGYNNKLENVRVEGVTTTASTLSDTASLPYLVPGATLPTGIRKISTEWHPEFRVKTRIAEPQKIITNIYNNQPDPFNANQTLSCAPASVTAPLLCKKVEQATIDLNGAAGFAAILDTSLAAREWRYTYNELGKPLTVSTPRSLLNNTTETVYEYYSYDSSDWRKGDLKQISNALGHSTQYTRYDANGRLLEIVDANGVVSQFTYDLRGRLLTATQANATTQYAYDPVGNLIRVTQPDGVYLEYDYDNASRLIRIRDQVGNKIDYTLDKASNITAIKYSDNADALRYQQARVYDALSRVQNIIDGNNNSNTLKYDASGNMTSEIDAKNQTTSQTYDGLDQFKQRTDALSGKINYTYDAQGNLTQVKDPRNNSTHYKYNSFGDLVEQASPDTGKTTFAYDAAGNRVSSTDARNISTNYTYDVAGRLTQIIYPTASENVTYHYDGAGLSAADTQYAKGRLTSVVTANMRLDFIYNAQGFINKKRVQVSGLTNNTEYTYNPAGRLTKIIYPSSREVMYEYNTSGAISAIRTKVNSTATETTIVSNINYLPFGPANSFTFGNGLTHTLSFDLNYQLTGIQVGGIYDRAYVYDAVNNITGIANNVNNLQSQTYSYDALNRLTTALGDYGNLAYSYDAVGNRLSETRNGIADTYIYPATSNRLNSITRNNGNRNFTYDAAGNPTQRTSDDNQSHDNTFNNANRLSSVNVDSTLAATYTYNPLGQRVIKTLANGTKEIYHYDEAGQLISVTDGTGTTIREYIYWGNQLISIVMNGNIYYAHTDHLNTPQVVTNQSQQVVWMGNYEPFGKLAANQSNSIEIFSRFPGQYLDSETNLYYNYFRDYDPSIGRYIESDPIGLEGGLNTYAYVEGNPISNIDPLGLQTKLCPRCIPIIPVPGTTPSDDGGFDHSNPFTIPKPNTSPSFEFPDFGEKPSTVEQGSATTPAPYKHWEEDEARYFLPNPWGGDDECERIKKMIQILRAQIAWRNTDLNSRSASYAGHIKRINILTAELARLERAYRDICGKNCP